MSITFPKRIFATYLRKIGRTEIKELTYEQKKQVFVMAVKDFYNHGLSVDQLSGIGEILWESLDKSRGSEDELSQVAHAASELGYYLRAIDKIDSHSAVVFVKFLVDIHNFYTKYRGLI